MNVVCFLKSNDFALPLISMAWTFSEEIYLTTSSRSHSEETIKFPKLWASLRSIVPVFHKITPFLLTLAHHSCSPFDLLSKKIDQIRTIEIWLWVKLYVWLLNSRRWKELLLKSVIFPVDLDSQLRFILRWHCLLFMIIAA